MTPRTLALVIAALAPMHVSSVNAQSVYVAPGGVYVGAGPVYVIPAPNHPGVGYVAPTYGNEYGPPVAPRPRSSLRRRLMDLAKATTTPRFRPMEPGCRRGRLSRCPTTGTVVVSPDTATTAVTDPHRRLSHRTTSRHAVGGPHR